LSLSPLLSPKLLALPIKDRTDPPTEDPNLRNHNTLLVTHSIHSPGLISSLLASPIPAPNFSATVVDSFAFDSQSKHIHSKPRKKHSKEPSKKHSKPKLSDTISTLPRPPALDFGIHPKLGKNHSPYLPLPRTSISIPRDNRPDEEKENEVQIVRTQWIDCLQELSEVGIPLAIINQWVPFLACDLALHSQEAAEKFDQDQRNDQLERLESSHCSSWLRRGYFEQVPCVLKIKASIIPGTANPLDEILAGEKIRLAVLQEILRIYRENPTLTLEDIREAIEFLRHIVAAVDCGTYIATREVPQARLLIDIILLFLERAEMHFDMDATIAMAERIRRIIVFLHANGIYHNDLTPRNFVIRGNDYAQVYMIDFGAATFDPQNQIDSTLIGWFFFQYVFCCLLTQTCPSHDECYQLLLDQFQEQEQMERAEPIEQEQMEQMRSLIFADF
jgi:tRNA A-37 threonylcarbamoyl transferase component Bud32